MADINNSQYKIAVASTDGITVNEHFGRSKKFFIYFIDENVGFDLIEEREAESVCMNQTHLIPKMQEKINLIKDCRYVVTARTGAGALGVLFQNGITSIEFPGEIEEAVLKVCKYNKLMKITGINK